MVTIADFDQERYAATDQVRCISIYVPDDDSYLPLLAGLLSLPGYQTNYQDPESAQAEGVAAVWRDAYIQTDWSPCVTPSMTGNQTRVSLWHRWAQIAVGNPLQIVVDATMLFNHYVRQNTAAIGDETYQDVWLPAGEFEIRCLHLRAVVNGQLTVIVQNVDTLDQVTPISAVDLFGTTLANQVVTGNFSLDEPGHYRVYTHVPGKNASSSGFFIPLVMSEIWKTADP